MNKKKAKIEAIENNRTWGDLLKLVKDTRGKYEISKLNKALTLEQCLNIFEGAVSKRDLTGKPKIMRYDRRGDWVFGGGDAIVVMNILRECAK